LVFALVARYVIVTAVLAEGVWIQSQRRRLVRLCALLSGDPEAAEDLAQETMLEAWRNRHKLVDDAGAERWLGAIARNVCFRWGRRRGRDAAVLAAAADSVDERERDEAPGELEEALDGALALLPATTRDLLVRHYVEGAPQRELAARYGISEDAVSMRLGRGRALLRRRLADDGGEAAGDGWRETRVWCASCGGRKLQMLRRSDAVAFRCPACAPAASAMYDLRNPSFAAVVGERVRPTAIIGRTAAWSSEYFRRGAADVGCTRCRRALRLRHGTAAGRRGLRGECRACGQAVWSSVRGLAQGLPDARAFRAEHGRVRTLPERDLHYRGTEATLVRLESARSSAVLDVFFTRDTLRLLAVH
jgi:RNA polymerase sigma factor (sigma-70 family)